MAKSETGGATPSAETITEQGGEKKVFTVSLPGAPTHQIEAVSPGDAWNKYKKLCGILKTKAKPKIGLGGSAASDGDEKQAAAAGGEQGKPATVTKQESDELASLLTPSPENPDPAFSLTTEGALVADDSAAGDPAGDPAEAEEKLKEQKKAETDAVTKTDESAADSKSTAAKTTAAKSAK